MTAVQLKPTPVATIASSLAPKDEAAIKARFSKLVKALRYYLQGAADQNPDYYIPLRAFNLAMGTHVGVRKDGVTPEFVHQLETTLFLRTLRSSIKNLHIVLAVQLLHDITEDYGFTYEQLQEKFGTEVAEGVLRMSKVVDGRKLSNEEYFREMLKSPVATLCKGADRIHNQQSMPGVFSLQKQQEYLAETEKYILPMLKQARRLYPEQENAYENIKFILKSQVELVKGMLELAEAKAC